MTETKRNKSDFFIYLIGILIVGFALFKIIEYILPDRKPEYTGDQFIKELVNKNGGLESWNNISKISYQKSFQLYDKKSVIELSQDETHRYNFTNGLDRQISWSEDATLYKIHQTDASLYQSKNNKIDSAITKLQLQSKVDAATFVIGFPYTLKTSTANYTYKGITTFQNISCNTLEVRFADSQDIWTFYYEEDTFAFKGYWVKTSDHYSLVINDEMVNVNGFTLPKKRTSYRTDSLQNVLYKKASYLYKNYKIETNSPKP